MTETVKTVVINWAANKRLREIHDLVSAFAGAGVFSTLVGSAMRTLPPGVTPSWPVTTTRSPGVNALINDHQVALPLPHGNGAQLSSGVLFNHVDKGTFS